MAGHSARWGYCSAFEKGELDSPTFTPVGTAMSATCCHVVIMPLITDLVFHPQPVVQPLKFPFNTLHQYFKVMTFVIAVAGPSRIPATVVSAAVPGSRRAVACCGRSTAARRYASSAPGTSEEGADGRSEREIRAAERKDKAFWSGPDGYKRFLKQTAAQFEAPAPGSKARWLGGSVVRPFFPCASRVNVLIYSHTHQIRASNLRLHCQTTFRMSCTPP